MTPIQLMAEYIIIGGVFLIGLARIAGVSLDSFFNLPERWETPTAALLLAALAYVLGFFINVAAEAIIKPLHDITEKKWMHREGNLAIRLHQVRYDLYASGRSDIVNRMEYHRSLLRLARSIGLVTTILFVLAILFSNFTSALVLALITAFAVYSYQRRVKWFTKSTYYSWLAIHRASEKHVLSESRISGSSVRTTKKGEKPKILIFGGGTGLREITIELVRKSFQITRVVPAWDNGGSSKILRKAFNLLPVGDIRHALMTMAHGEKRMDEVVRLFNWRLPKHFQDGSPGDKLREELETFVNGIHPLIAAVEPSLRVVITNYLSRFNNDLPEQIDLQHGSIGNFILVGATLSHQMDINTAIYVFRQLCSIEGRVWPTSLENNLHLIAFLEDGNKIIGQDSITNIDREHCRALIKDIFLIHNLERVMDNDLKAQTVPNPLVIDAVHEADLVIFGPGSFFTSIIPHLMVNGIADAIATTNIPKVLLGNITECPETYGYTLKDLINIFLRTAGNYGSTPRKMEHYLNHVFAHDSQKFGLHPIGGICYLPIGEDLDQLEDKGLKILHDNFENTWNRGHHDPILVSRYLQDIIGEE